MAATNYTPIQLYYSTTASAAPTAGNLASGELAINITDGKLYYKDNGGVVQVIATKGAGTIGGSTTQIQYNNAGALAGSASMTFNSGTNVTTLTTLNLTNALGATYGGTAQSAYAQGDVLYASATNTLSKLGIGTVNYILTSTGSVPQWSAPSSIIVQTATNLAGGAGGSVPYQSAADTTTFLAIGAANRVMTSSGSAPQWVTALTGLTGVSSSSITDTGLTSGRVTYASTGGLLADSTNLTFNGTTLSAGGFSTTGLSTLVQTVKIGDSNFSGVAVFAPATPAKLYIGTGTVTDATSAIGATNTTGAISSLAITPIAATNTSVTYTNASTLYIAGAPSAGTNITITNPYSLYVAAGASYFGGAVTFASSIGALTVSSLTDTGLTSGRVTYATTGGLLTDNANLQFDGTSMGVGAAPISTVRQYIKGTGATNATWALYVDNSTPTNIFAVRNDGYIGVGISTPSNLVTIQGDATGSSFADNAVAQLVIRGATSTVKRLGLGFDTTNNFGVIQAQNYGTGAYPLALNPVGGNVGVGTGTTSPAYRLDVRVTGTGNVANFQSDSGPNIRFTGTETSGRTYQIGEGLVTAGSFSIYDTTGGAERVQLGSTGNWLFSTVTTNVSWATSTSAGDTMPTIYFPNRSDGTTNANQSGSGIGQAFSDANGTAPASVNFVRTGGTGGGATSGSAVTFNATRNTYSPYGAYTNAEVFRATGAGVIDFSSTGFDTAGIRFPATQLASANANTLDDYEEGTWTAAMPTESGTNYTITSQTCRYTKIGNTVTVNANITYSAVGNGSISRVTLPFTPLQSPITIVFTATITGTSGANYITELSLIPYTGNELLLRVSNINTNYWSASNSWSSSGTLSFCGTFITST